jgi:hypothetical protein
MPSNEEMLKKVITAADALATSGALNSVQASKFIDYVFEETVFKGNARTVKFRPETLDIDKIGVGRRVMYPFSEGVEPAGRVGVSHSKVSLTPVANVVPFEISDDYVQYNIEGDDVEDHVIRMMAKQVANNVESLQIEGDALGVADLQDNVLPWGGSTTQYVKDAMLSEFDGWLRLADGGHVVDAAGNNIGASLFAQTERAMPTKFRRNRRDLRWFCSSNLASLWREKVSTRATQAGDVALGSADSVSPFGIPMVEAPLFPFEPVIVEHVVLTGTDTIDLRYSPLLDGSETVLDSTLNSTPATPYVEGSGNDYVMDYINGTITRDATSSIGAGATVKITYTARPQLLLSHWMNFIVGIGLDISIEKDRSIYRKMNLYAIHLKVAAQLEETDAMAKLVNIGLGI